MGHAGRQKADAGQLLAADDLLGPLLDLPIEVVADFLEAGRHRVHRLGQLAHLVVRVEANAVVELAGRHLARAFDQRLQRLGDPFAEQLHRRDQQQRGQ